MEITVLIGIAILIGLNLWTRELSASVIPGPSINLYSMIDRWRGIVGVVADNYGVNPNEIYAVMWNESRGDPNAQGKTTDFGLMQITPIVLKEYQRENGPLYIMSDLYNPSVNIDVGTWYLSRLTNHYGYNSRALRFQAYNAGPTAVRKNLDAGKTYSARVMSTFSTLTRG